VLVRRIRLTLIAAATALPVVLATLTSDAGSQQAGSSYCMKFSADAGGYCYGTMEGFRSSSDSTAYAQFQTMVASSTLSPGFGAEYGGQYYYCVPPTTGAWASAWPSTSSLRGYFFIEFDGSGNCTVLETFNGSEYAPY
jgi:hypothetical protein